MGIFRIHYTTDQPSSLASARKEQETNWERLGARPREPIVASAPPPAISKEREAYLYLSELAGKLQTYDLGEEEIRRDELAANETKITSTEQTTIDCDISRGFFELYGNKNICDIPEEDLLFEVKFLLSYNNRDIPNDGDLLEALRAFIITRQIQTPMHLFQLLELKTYYSPLVSPTEAISKVNTPVRNPTVQQCSTSEKTAPNLMTLVPHNRIIQHYSGNCRRSVRRGSYNSSDPKSTYCNLP